MAAFPLACPQKHQIRNNNNKNNEKNVLTIQRIFGQHFATFYPIVQVTSSLTQYILRRR